MSRITDRLVVQRVADEIVFLDQLTGDEVVFSVEVIPNVFAAMGYLADPEGEWLTSYLKQETKRALLAAAEEMPGASGSHVDYWDGQEVQYESYETAPNDLSPKTWLRKRAEEA